MKKQRKIVFWAASLLLTGALAAGGTLAYLTDKDSVTNQFVVGKVDIEGHEPSYAPDPDGKTNHIVPTQVIPKDPRIKNKGKNDSYVYMDVSIPIAKVIVADTSGNRLNGGAAVDTELFSMNQLSKKWVLMYKKKQNNSMVYTYLYNEVLAAGKTTDPLFTSVTAANIVEGQLDEKEVDIPINYYAIQALNTGEGSTAAERAAKAWEKYGTDNSRRRKHQNLGGTRRLAAGDPFRRAEQDRENAPENVSDTDEIFPLALPVGQRSEQEGCNGGGDGRNGDHPGNDGGVLGDFCVYEGIEPLVFDVPA